MSSSISTRAGLSSSAIALSGRCWRVVEAQHRVSTMKLTDSLPEQAMLERLIEETKPQIPEGSARLDYLLMTPFRYGPTNPYGSRFRRPHSAGVFYGAEHPATAIAEMAFHRLLFFAESPKTPWPQNAGEYTAFAVTFHSERGLDMTLEPYRDDAAIFHLTSYETSQAFADDARTAGIEVLKYVSVRDPERRPNFALLKPSVFTHPEPVDRQSWRIHLDSHSARAICEMPQVSLAFGREVFAADIRIREMVWER
jgi:RES domain